jgi:hypothetical protein
VSARSGGIGFDVVETGANDQPPDANTITSPGPLLRTALISAAIRQPPQCFSIAPNASLP